MCLTSMGLPPSSTPVVFPPDTHWSWCHQTVPDNDKLGTYYHDKVFLDKLQKDIQTVWDSRIEPEPQVTCRAVLPVPEAVSKTAHMPIACQFTVPQTLCLLVDGNEIFYQWIAMFSARLQFKDDAVRRRLGKAVVIRPTHEQVFIVPLAQPAGTKTRTLSSCGRSVKSR